jgi:hypothetical protein
MLDWAHRAVHLKAENVHVLFAEGAAMYRVGQLDQAVAHCTRSIRSWPLWSANDLNWYTLALAHHRLGHDEEARRWFDLVEASLTAKERKAAERPAPPPGYYIVDDLEAQVLRREARALIASKPAR